MILVTYISQCALSRYISYQPTYACYIQNMFSNLFYALTNIWSLIKILFRNYTMKSQLNRMPHPQYNDTRCPSNRFWAEDLPQWGSSITSFSLACSCHLYHQDLSDPLFVILISYIYIPLSWLELNSHLILACLHHFPHAVSLLLAFSLFFSLLLRRWLFIPYPLFLHCYS